MNDLEAFAKLVQALDKADWETAIAPSLGTDLARTVVQECTASFDTLTDAIRGAARIPQDRKVDPEELRATCRYALGQILAF